MKGEYKMTIDKKIEIELTSEEEQALLKARDLIDILIDKMNTYNLETVISDYDAYDKSRLDEIATDLHSLSTICEGA